MNIFQIGTCKGNDDLTQLIADKDIDLLVLVEPLDVHNNDIESCYKHINNKHIENIAICIDPNIKNITFYYHKNDGPLYEVASLNPNHILKHGYSSDGIIKKNVTSMTVNELFDKYNVNNIDILFIDAEGLDDYIIYSIDFNKFKIVELYFENLHLNTNVFPYLIDKGYDITHRVGYNGWSSLAKKMP